jgi:uncharacterized membrane protein YfcA
MSETNTVVAMLVLGLIAGVLSGMFGIGGGLVIVPALILGFGFGPKVATGTSLFALMWPVGLLGVIEYWKRNELRIVPGFLIALGLFLGAYFGAKITGALSQVTMKRLYGVFLLVVGTYFLYTSRDRVAAEPARAAPQALPPLSAEAPAPASAPAEAQVQRPPDLS